MHYSRIRPFICRSEFDPRPYVLHSTRRSIVLPPDSEIHSFFTGLHESFFFFVWTPESNRPSLNSDIHPFFLGPRDPFILHWTPGSILPLFLVSGIYPLYSVLRNPIGLHWTPGSIRPSQDFGIYTAATEPPIHTTTIGIRDPFVFHWSPGSIRPCLNSAIHSDPLVLHWIRFPTRFRFY